MAKVVVSHWPKAGGLHGPNTLAYLAPPPVSNVEKKSFMRLRPGRLWFDPKLGSWISFFGFFSQVVHLERKGLERKASGIDYKQIAIVIDDSRVMPQFGTSLWRHHLRLI
jgi:hypothetical protein